MRLFLSQCSFVLMSCLWLAPIAHSETYTYRVYNHPEVDRGVSCSDRAAAYSARLAEATGVRVLGALCEYSDVVQSHSIIIRYAAESPLQTVSTYTFAATYADKGVYQTLAECLAALPTEVATFESRTDLQVFLSFCGRERLESDRPYYAHVDGFGQPRMWPSRAYWNTNYPHGDAAERLRAEVVEGMALRGADLIHLTIRPRGSFGNATVFFYGSEEDQRLQMTGTEVMTIPGLADCEEQLLALRSQLQGTLPAVTGYCTSPYSNPTRFELALVYFGFQTFNFVESSQEYANLRECKAAEEAITENMRIVYGERLLGAACGLRRFSGGGRNDRYRVIGLGKY
jgi:hypothetical protein